MGSKAQEDPQSPEYQQYMALPVTSNDDEGSHHDPEHFRTASRYPATPPSDVAPVAVQQVSPATCPWIHIQARHTRGAAAMENLMADQPSLSRSLSTSFVPVHVDVAGNVLANPFSVADELVPGTRAAANYAIPAVPLAISPQALRKQEPSHQVLAKPSSRMYLPLTSLISRVHRLHWNYPRDGRLSLTYRIKTTDANRTSQAAIPTFDQISSTYPDGIDLCPPTGAPRGLRHHR